MSFNYSSDILGRGAENGIKVNSCGELRFSTNSHIIRPRGRKDYQLIYICSGNCYVKVRGETLAAGQGDAVFYRPGEVQDYMFLGKEAPRAYWVHFFGDRLDEMFGQLMSADGNVIKGVKSRDVEYLVGSMCKHFNLKTNDYPVICTGMLVSVLALINNRLLGTDEVADKNAGLISELISKLKYYQNLEMNVADCARMCSLSLSHFTRVFREITGQSPQQFIINLRISRAKELLSYTDMNISEIAEASGFHDQNYFARVFKKSVGQTPSEYRKS